MKTQIFLGLTGLFGSILFLLITIDQFIRKVNLKESPKSELTEIHHAQEELKIAEQDFNLAEPRYTEIATFKLKAAQMKYNELLKIKKAV